MTPTVQWKPNCFADHQISTVWFLGLNPLFKWFSQKTIISITYINRFRKMLFSFETKFPVSTYISCVNGKRKRTAKSEIYSFACERLQYLPTIAQLHLHVHWAASVVVTDVISFSQLCITYVNCGNLVSFYGYFVMLISWMTWYPVVDNN